MEIEEQIGIKYRKYIPKIPDSHHDPMEISKQLKINIEILCEEITNHINKELERLDVELNKRFNIDKE